MTKYYTNKPDFSGDPTYPLVSSDSYFKSMSSIMDDIEAAGKVVKDEGVEDLYSQTGEASLGTTKDSTTFDKSLKRIYNMLTSAKKVHSDIMQNIDSKFTKGMDEAFTTLNNVNSSSKPYKSKYTKKTVSKKVLAGYKADGNAVYIDSTEVKSYNLSEILDGKASPIQAAKAVYDDRIKAVKEMMAKKDQLSDEQIKAIEGKSAEEVVAVRYPGQLPDYQRLKASRYYEENKESLQYVDIRLKTLAVLSMIGGAALAPATGGTSLTATYAGGTYLAADSAYSAIEGHSFITGTQLTTEERIWAGIDLDCYYYNNSLAFPGLFTQEIMTALYIAAQKKEKYHLYLQSSLLSINSGEKVPVDTNVVISRDEIDLMISYIDRLIKKHWVEGMKYFYGHPVEN